MARFLALLFFAGAIAALSGCASTEPEDPNRVSSIPWNRPQKWEGQGALGGMAPQSQ
ncbi:MAG: hypothetical protein JWL90_3526 [Chthoniobacteraceae bacterium]|nr:hypothetical protein [Chthoniobacteraceae bacterium]